MDQEKKKNNVAYNIGIYLQQSQQSFKRYYRSNKENKKVRSLSAKKKGKNVDGLDEHPIMRSLETLNDEVNPYENIFTVKK